MTDQLKCPECGSIDRVEVEATAWRHVDVGPDGEVRNRPSDGVEDVRWEQTSPARCLACLWTGSAYHLTDDVDPRFKDIINTVKQGEDARTWESRVRFAIEGHAKLKALIDREGYSPTPVEQVMIKELTSRLKTMFQFEEDHDIRT